MSEWEWVFWVTVFSSPGHGDVTVQPGPAPHRSSAVSLYLQHSVSLPAAQWLLRHLHDHIWTGTAPPAATWGTPGTQEQQEGACSGHCEPSRRFVDSSIIMLQRPNIWRVSVLLLPLQLPVRVPAPPVQTVREDPTLGGCRPVNAVNVVVRTSSGHCESPVDTSTGIVLLLLCYLFIVDICSSTAWGPSETFWPTVVDSQQQSQQQCNC